MNDEYLYTYKAFPVPAFWSNVEVTDTCWRWTKTTKKRAYGSWTWNRKSINPGRFLKIMLDAPSDQSLFACHKCDNPACIRPSHLFWGTQSDNIKDAVKKGRWRHRGFIGRRPDNQVLEKQHVWFIRAFHGSASTQSIAKILKIKKKYVWSVHSGFCWKSAEFDVNKCLKLLLKHHKDWLISVMPGMLPKGANLVKKGQGKNPMATNGG